MMKKVSERVKVLFRVREMAKKFVVYADANGVSEPHRVIWVKSAPQHIRSSDLNILKYTQAPSRNGRGNVIKSIFGVVSVEWRTWPKRKVE